MTPRDRELLDLSYWDSLVLADAWALATLVPVSHVALVAQASVGAELAIAKARIGIGDDHAADWGG